MSYAGITLVLPQSLVCRPETQPFPARPAWMIENNRGQGQGCHLGEKATVDYNVAVPLSAVSTVTAWAQA